MNILINGEAHTTERTSLEGIISEHLKLDTPFAIAINANFIPKVNYAKTTVSEGDSIEILSPMQGG